jgi:phage protein D
VKAATALLLMLPAAAGWAAAAYVTDELVLGVYASQNGQGQRLTTLHSGAAVETLAVNGDSTQVRLADGVVGWVKSAYLVTSAPATVRIKQLQDELDRSRATTPELAEAAERSEVERLTRELAAAQTAAARAGANAPLPAAARATPVLEAPAGGTAHGSALHVGLWVAAVITALAGGFWLGYASLARRIRYKFGGIKVY